MLAQTTAAHLLAILAERPLLTLDLEQVVHNGLSLQTSIELALRDARLTDAIPFFVNWQVCLEDGAPPASLLERLCEHPGLLLIAGTTKWLPHNTVRDRRLRWLPFPSPDYEQRQTLLHHLVDEVEIPKNVTPDVTASLAGQFTLTTQQWRDVVNTAADMAVQDEQPLDRELLFAAAREHSNPRISTLARKITARYNWGDLILPDDQTEILHEVVNTVRYRSLVLEQWGVGRSLVSSAGVAILFAGPPGTGKTMAAEVLARELGLDLFKIDLSGVVSKYIGETEKNLEQIFAEAENSSAILFFDEADAIFGKRSEVSDAHDRHANIEVSYLLQRMESYDGVTILATNLRANLDEAFTRRMQFAVDFPFPDEADRRRIWETLLPDRVPLEDHLDLDYMARQFRLSGGNIRNILVNAAYQAAASGGKVGMAHLLHGARRELQKMGRMIEPSDFVL